MERQFFVVFFLAALLLSACGPGSATAKLPDGISVHVEATKPLAIGPVPLRITITDETGAPAPVTRLSVVGDMTHAGMVPVHADVLSTQPDGSHLAEDFVFTMAGDWFIQIDFTLETGVDGETEAFFTIPAR